ncbi:SMC domain protein [Sulfuricurvum kujiense DSM 16994]|uniref:SMC domain protein n=1 Tax=Sulfuricurvum kujiense (strain ATCC BAA-921 / DSM 16994 / JCM 11577 / YK-1) TaxID=709032 RepID=E4TX31_SULKY|nr:SMC family ATPase [Sulfuricurvum kujiense]ADR33872.1 SMC domain protein [Sulfuricurvum kujiense DSM 16994]
MTLESLRLQNFKRYAEYEITFESGLCGILGRNGRGKSTIFDGVFFALYGEYKGSKELIPTAGSTGGVKVELNFEIEGKSYTAIREFRGKALTAYATLKEADVSIITGAREVSTAVTKLLGMGKEAFLHTVFASQKELTALSSMKNDERKAMMRRLLGLEKIDKIEEMIREELRELNRELKSASGFLLGDDVLKAHREDHKSKTETALTLETRIKQLNEEAATLKSAYEAAKVLVETHQRAKEERQKKLDSLDKLQQALALEQKQLTALDEELKTLQAQQSRYTSQLPQKARFDALEKSLSEQESLKAAFLKKEGLEKEQEELRKSYTARKEEVAQLIKETAPLETLKTQLIQEQTQFKALKSAFDTLTEQITRTTAEIASNRTNIAGVQEKVSRITELGAESACPVCTRPLLENYDAVLSSLHREIIDVYQRQIDEAQIRLNTLNEQKTQQQKALTEAETRQSTTDKQIALLLSKTHDLAKAQEKFREIETRGLANKTALAQLVNINYDEKVHIALRGERDTLKPQVDALLSLEALIATIPAKTEAAQKLGAQIQTDTQSIAAQQKLISEDTYSEKAHADAAVHVKTAESAKDAKAVEHNAALLEQTNLRRDIEAIDKEIKRDETNRASLKSRENDRDDYEKLKAVMAEFKTHINARVAPHIGEVASEMYSRITRGRYQHIEVSPEFDFYIYDNGERYPIERFSGGEIDLANLVLRIAISKTLGELSGGDNIGFLAFDEVFGSQDEERRIQIMEAFHTISESYRQIFLISHETEIKEMFEKVVEL